MNGVRRILCQTGLGAEFWAEAASYMCYTRNRTPCGPQKQIPDDLWQQHKTKLHHLQPFGCRLFYQDYHNTSKLASRHREAILMGDVEGTHNYQAWNSKNRKIIKIRDWVFVNNMSNLNLAAPPSLLDVQRHEPDTVVVNQSINHDDQQSKPSSPRYFSQRLAEIENQHISQEQSNSNSCDGFQSYSSDDPLLLQPVYAIMTTMELETIAEAQQNNDWSQWEFVMKAELAKMNKYNVWTVVKFDSVPNIRTVGAKWVYTRKIDGKTSKLSK